MADSSHRLAAKNRRGVRIRSSHEGLVICGLARILFVRNLLLPLLLIHGLVGARVPGHLLRHRDGAQSVQLRRNGLGRGLFRRRRIRGGGHGGVILVGKRGAAQEHQGPRDEARRQRTLVDELRELGQPGGEAGGRAAGCADLREGRLAEVLGVAITEASLDRVVEALPDLRQPPGRPPLHLALLQREGLRILWEGALEQEPGLREAAHVTIDRVRNDEVGGLR
mmetsp:Transcript_139417/g.445917  ORF Transcript_139417/g.445917 Transcript_139417/m.445917 type:complete len:224 (-) Transcript_139417:370-1041(-)